MKPDSSSPWFVFRMHPTIAPLLLSPFQPQPPPSYTLQLLFLPLWLLPPAMFPHSSPTLILALGVAPPTILIFLDAPREVRVFTLSTGVVLQPFHFFAYICLFSCECLLLIEYMTYFFWTHDLCLPFFNKVWSYVTSQVNMSHIMTHASSDLWLVLPMTHTSSDSWLGLLMTRTLLWLVYYCNSYFSIKE